MASSHNGGTTAENIGFLTSAGGGTYRVRVRGVAGDADPSQPYRLKLNSGTAHPTPTLTPTPTSTPVPACGPDPYEPNNSNVTAASIATGTEIHAYLCPETDYDWYTFHVAGAVEIHTQLYDLPEAYGLTLYDPSGWPVAWDSSTDTMPRELAHLSTTDGDYLLRIGPSSPTFWDEDDAYSLLVNLDALRPIALLAVADTYVEETDPTSTHGDERRVAVGRDEFEYEQRGLFRFDLSDVPATTIASAFFRASLSGSESGVYTVELLRVSASWDEEAVDWDTQPWAASTGVSAAVGGIEGQTVLLITHVSTQFPEVTLLSPNGGESWPPCGEHTVSWTGSDADGDPVRYVLQYSSDGGSTWRAVATNLVGESYALEAGRLAGSETAFLRVVASDGVNTSQDKSDGTFTVEGKPPGAYILYPLDGSAFLPGKPVVLEGAGTTHLWVNEWDSSGSLVCSSPEAMLRARGGCPKARRAGGRFRCRFEQWLGLAPMLSRPETLRVY